VRLAINAGEIMLYWSDNAEASRDLFTNRRHFEGYRLWIAGPAATAQDSLQLLRQWDLPGNGIGYDNGFEELRIRDASGSPVCYFFGYVYRYRIGNLLDGWLYRIALTAFSSPDEPNGIPSLESSPLATELLVIPGRPPVRLDTVERVGIYPNPYRLGAAWEPGACRRKLRGAGD
jgi:hypothetical protein